MKGNEGEYLCIYMYDFYDIYMTYELMMNIFFYKINSIITERVKALDSRSKTNCPNESRIKSHTMDIIDLMKILVNNDIHLMLKTQYIQNLIQDSFRLSKSIYGKHYDLNIHCM